MAALTRLPVVGDTVRQGGYEFRILELDGRRISRVSVTALEPPANAPEADGQAPLEG